MTTLKSNKQKLYKLIKELTRRLQTLHLQLSDPNAKIGAEKILKIKQQIQMLTTQLKDFTQFEHEFFDFSARLVEAVIQLHNTNYPVANSATILTELDPALLTLVKTVGNTTYRHTAVHQLFATYNHVADQLPEQPSAELVQQLLDSTHTKADHIASEAAKANQAAQELLDQMQNLHLNKQQVPAELQQQAFAASLTSFAINATATLTSEEINYLHYIS